MGEMVTDILLQVCLILVTVFMFLAMHNIPQKLFSKLRLRNRANVQAKRNFVQGAQLLTQARSAKSRSAAAPFAKEALVHADQAIALDPKDAAAHILKALVLDFQGFKTSALDSLDAALSPLAAKSLGAEERGDALYKRAELKMAVSRRGGVESALNDLNESVTLNRKNAKAFSLLGECYEIKKLKDEAIESHEEALRLNPQLAVSREALDRLVS